MNISQVSILMVDDKQENLLALEAVLAPLGHELIGLRSGEDALRFILKENLDQLAVILLDVQMPGMDGFETAKLIKRRDKAREIPIIFITALSKSLDHVLHGYHVGSIDYILKPFYPDLLRRKVEAFVTMHRYHQQVKEQGKLLKERAYELEMMNKKLIKTEALARMVSETSIDSIITCDERGIIVSTNPAVETMFGFSSHQVVGQHVHRLIPDILPHSNPGVLMEMVAKKRNGGTFPVDVQLGKATVDDQVFYVCSIRDITEKKQIEQERNEKYDILEKMVVERTQEIVETNEKLQKSQEHFEKLFVSSPCLMAIRRLSDMTYVDINESWLKFTGYNKKELIRQKNDLFINMIMNESNPKTYQSGKRGINIQIQYKTKNLEVRDGLLSVEIIEIDGEMCELLVIIDITDKVNWEKEMVRLGKLNLIGEMAAGIAHEIRNPMTAIKGFLQIYKENQVMNREYIDIMLEELNRANNIITEYLSLSKNKPTNMEPCQLNVVIELLMPLLQADATLMGKYIETSYGECPNVYLDEKEIRQLILNLGMNGLEAMGPGKMLVVSTYKEDNYVVLKVQDQGNGIHPDHIEKLGTPFFTTKESGTGLGLAVCYSIASRHRALISIKSDSEGTTVYVKFRQAVP